MGALVKARPPRENETDRQIRRFQSEVGEIQDAPVPRHLRVTLYAAASMIVSLVLVACLFDMDRVVSSTFGQIVTTEPTIVIQPLDQSIVKSIAVSEGQRVKAGDLLAELDPTFAEADVGALVSQVDSLDAEIARCEAEEAGGPYDFHPAANAGAQRYATLQASLYQQRKAQFDAQLHSYDEQVSQAAASMAVLKNNIARFGDRAKLTQELEDIRNALVREQLETRVNLLQTSDQKLELLRNQEEARNTLEATQHQYEAAKGTRDAFVKQWHTQTVQELVAARNSRDSASQQLEKAQRHRSLVRLVAPDDAIVLRVDKVSVGSVMQPGEVFMELASLKSPVEAEISIDPHEIGFVRPGDVTVLKLDPYNFVEHGYARGVLSWVSEGTFVASDAGTAGATGMSGTSTQGESDSQSTGMRSPGPFYKARVRIESTDFKDVPDDFRLLPGMTLAADIKVGKRPMIWYLASGFVRGLSESMREP